MISMIYCIASGLHIFIYLHCVMSNYYVLHLYAISLSLKDPPKTWPPQKVVVKFYTSVIGVDIEIHQKTLNVAAFKRTMATSPLMSQQIRSV